jgi:hypothetical protein
MGVKGALSLRPAEIGLWAIRFRLETVADWPDSGGVQPETGGGEKRNPMAMGPGGKRVKIRER